MEESSPASKFRFRGQQQMADGDRPEIDAGSESPSVSSVGGGRYRDGDESGLESMTGKGIAHLCSELLELKRVSDEDFHKTVFSSYSAFVRVFKEAEGMENDLIQLKDHVSTQKRLVKELTDGIYLKILSKETVKSIIEEPIYVEPSPQSTLEAHTDNVSEALDLLLSERRLDEALAFLELEAETFQGMQLQENFPLNVVACYNSVISARKAMIADQLKLVAGNPRVPAPELLKALVGLCRVGDSRLATQLLLNYYHLRISSGIHDLQCPKSANGACIHEIAKFVFSMISQAKTSFLVLYGEKTAYPLELMQWACEETELFAACFNKYSQSISDISGGLVTVIEAVQSALSYCSLLEAQGMLLHSCLVKHIRPCVAEFLQIHLDHFKKVIGIFTSTDTWVVGRYLLSGILSKKCSSAVIGKRPEYCLLTNSGRKFVTLLQAITEDISPLVAIQLEGPILRGLMDLFTKYIAVLESALTSELNGLEKGGPGVNFAESSEQQVSIIANLSTLVDLFSSMVRSTFKDINHLNFEVDSFVLYTRNTCDQLRAHFCQQFICRIIYGNRYKLAPETWAGYQSDSVTSNDVMPSVVFQGLYLELRKFEKLAEDKFIKVDWLLELMRELMEAIFVSILNNEEMWTTIQEDLAVQQFGNFKQFVLDVQFLVEIARCGVYFSNNIMTASLALLSRLDSAFLSAGLDAKRYTVDEDWAINAAKEALQKLQKMRGTKSPSNESTDDLEQKAKEDLSVYASDSNKDDDATGVSGNSVDLADLVARNASEVLFTTDSAESNIEDKSCPPEEVVDLEDIGGSDDSSTVNYADAIFESENAVVEIAAEVTTKEVQKIQKIESLARQLSGGGGGKNTGLRFPQENESCSRGDKEGVGKVSKGYFVSMEETGGLQDEDGRNEAGNAAAGAALEDCKETTDL